MKIVIRNCPNLVNSHYADGKTIYNECNLSCNDKLCENINDCLLKKIYYTCNADIYFTDELEQYGKCKKAIEIIDLMKVEKNNEQKS